MPRCRNSSSSVRRLRNRPAAWLLAVSAALAAQASPADDAIAADSRQVYDGAAPAWLRAVGKLQVPGSTYRDGVSSHQFENCSATLVTSATGRGADTIITAWHCLVNYNDLSRTITFTLPTGARGSLQREAYRLADGGGMHADWALLRLRQPVAPGDVAALLIHPGRASAARAISMAGYSRDTGKGEGGNRLTFDPVCRITAQGPEITDSDCLAHKGASGGAVVQLSAAGTPQFSGVISEGNGLGLSTFVPVAAFRNAMSRHLGQPRQ